MRTYCSSVSPSVSSSGKRASVRKYRAKSAKTANAIASQVETGMVTINHLGLALPEVPFGGVKESGIGREGSSYGVDDWVELKYLAMGGIEELGQGRQMVVKR